MVSTDGCSNQYYNISVTVHLHLLPFSMISIRKINFIRVSGTGSLENIPTARVDECERQLVGLYQSDVIQKNLN